MPSGWGRSASTHLLNDFFRDIADAALECEAEIHKYVGDEAILTWAGDAGLDDGAALSCPFIARDAIAAHKARYLDRFGAVPTFARRSTAARSSPAKSATCGAKWPMSATR